MPNDDPDWANSILQPVRLIATITASNGATVNETHDVPQGVQGIGFMCDFVIPHVSPAVVEITGSTTGNSLVFEDTPGTGVFGDIIVQEIDTQVNVRVKAPAIGTCVVYLVGITGSLVQLFSRVFQAMVPVTFKTAQPNLSAAAAPWMSPFSSVVIDYTLNNSNQVLVAGVTGQAIYLHSWTATFSAIAAADVILESDSSGKVFDIWNAVGSVGPYRSDGKGVFAPVGEGIRIRNPFAVNCTVRGGLQFTQL